MFSNPVLHFSQLARPALAIVQILLRLISATAAPRSPWFGTVNHEHCCGRRRIVARAVTGTECPTLTAVTTFPRGGVAFGRLPCCSHLQSSSRWGFSSRNIGFRCIPPPPWLLRLPRHKPSGLALTARPNDAKTFTHPAAWPPHPAAQPRRPCGGERPRLPPGLPAERRGFLRLISSAPPF